MAVTVLPTPPSRSDDPTNFTTKADAFLAALPTFVTEVNALPIDSAGAASESAIAAANYLGDWSDQSGSVSIPASVTHDGNLWLLVDDTTATNDITATEPSSTNTDWRMFREMFLGVVNRSSNTELAYADWGRVIYASGTWSQTFDNAGDLADGWFVMIKNTGSGTITLDPTGAETIDGAASINLAPGEARFIICTGTSFSTMVMAAPAATTGYSGIVELATTAEAAAGTDTERAVTAAGLTAFRAAFPSGVFPETRAGTFTAIKTQNGSYFKCNGTWDLDLTAAATLGDGWHCYVENYGTGIINVSPDGTEQIDAFNSCFVLPHEVRLIATNGTSFYTQVLRPFYQTFTSSGTDNFTTPRSGYKSVAGLLWGGGGAGEAEHSGSSANGGGGGACVPFDIPLNDLASTETVTIGAGGQATAFSAGGDGGTSSFGSHLSAYGGCGGGESYPGGGGGALSAGNNNYGGAPYSYDNTDTNPGTGDNSGFGGAEATHNSTWGGAGGGYSDAAPAGDSVYGGGGGAHHDGNFSGSGGTSVFGGDGGDYGQNGVAPGGGGGGHEHSIDPQAGDGARGELRIWGVV